MDIETLRDYCLAKAGVTEEFPFDDKILVFKVGGKIFLLVDVDDAETINLKCDPEKAVELRAQFSDTVLPGYHMNKMHWNTVYVNRELDTKSLSFWIDHSYELVFKGLPKKLREEIEGIDRE